MTVELRPTTRIFIDWSVVKHGQSPSSTVYQQPGHGRFPLGISEFPWLLTLKRKKNLLTLRVTVNWYQ